jgi:hypothetical protein
MKAYPMNKAIKSHTHPQRIVFLVSILFFQACASPQGTTSRGPDPEKVKQASIMTNKCLLNYHDIPGSLSQRQECLNNASALLINDYGPEIQNVARLCAQKLSQLASQGDAGQIDLKGYQQKREMLKIECAEAAQAAKR